MTATPRQLSDVQTKINEIRSANRVRFLTNYFGAPDAGGEVRMFATEKSVIFLQPEHGFFRLCYFSADAADLAALLLEVPNHDDLVIGCVDKVKNEGLHQSFIEAGFELIATYQRMTNVRLPQRKTKAPPIFATPADTDELFDILRQTFNAMTDHLPEPAVLRDIIAKEQALVCRTDGKITGGLVFQIAGKQANFNFLFNHGGNPMDLLNLQNSFYQVMLDRGITSGFLWVDSRNTGVIKLHQAFGWKFDGLTDWLFARHAVPPAA